MSAQRDDPAPRRHVYPMGIVGNCAYMAHIDELTRVRWLCWPQFDSSFVFGSLLDEDKGGDFAVYGSEVERTRQAYRRNTNVLVTEVELADGVFRVTDCAPRFLQFDRFFKPLTLIRKIEPVRGNPRVRVVCRPRGAYGELEPHCYKQSNHIRYDLGDDRLRLNTNVPLSYVTAESFFVLNETKYLVLTWGVPLEAPLEPTAEQYLLRTVAYWEQWVRGCSISRFYQQEVIRSALALKLHQFEDTGAIIAAGTTSLPEAPGSQRNWDYRYCWLRDAYYTLNALSRISQFEEMQMFAHFIENIAATITARRYPPLVTIDGGFEVEERIVPLKGYDGADSVRIGNAAHHHVQNDIYGQIVFALLQLYVDERFSREVRPTSKRLIMTMLSKIEETLGEPDNTLWEYRNKKLRHGYTALCHWVGSKAAAKIAHTLGDAEMLRFATRLAGKSARQVEACYSPELGAYAEAPGSRQMDASMLQLIIFHFLEPTSERAARHLAAIERQLETRGGLLYRYRAADDFGVPQNAFLACAFWHVEALAAMGRLDEALGRLESLLKFSNHLGLFSEHVDPDTGGQWGNFPQTYSHVGLMNAVFRISSRVDYPEFF